MEKVITVDKIFAGNNIHVPSYQRAYLWDTEFDKSKIPKQVNVFLSNLESYNLSSSTTPYNFGHFSFEEKSDSNFAVIDGQQRLTTIVIFLSALFTKLGSLRGLTEQEEVIYENMIKRKSNYKFSTILYDNLLFREYVIDQTKQNNNSIDAMSANRIVNAFDFFSNEFNDKDEIYLTKMLKTVSKALCLTYSDKPELMQYL